jgi:hypothetical protein
MNKKLPFEEAIERQMDRLPADNEDQSWQKMKQLLDEKEKRSPFAIFKTYPILIILFLLLLGGLWLLVDSKNGKQRMVTASVNETGLKQQPQTNKSAESVTADLKPTVRHPMVEIENNKRTEQGAEANRTNIPKTKRYESVSATRRKGGNSFVSQTSSTRTIPTQKIVKPGKQTTANKTNADAIKAGKIFTNTSSAKANETAVVSENDKPGVDTSSNKQRTPPAGLHMLQTDSSVKKEAEADSANPLQDNPSLKRPKKFLVSVGLGVQQQIPLRGQQVVRIAQNGNKSTLSDYIPSVYFRFEKEQKWFVQGEFIYKSPQWVKEFAYSKQTQVDSSNAVTTTLRLKKTFNSEIPVSFNYYFRPNWTAGIGATYSWFYGAITERETSTKNRQTQANSVVQQIVPIPGYTDSFLYKSHTYLLLQTDYHWRQFSLGVRYSRDLQPYIKYTHPDGTITSKKNESLEFIFRVRLWKSARF